MLRWSIVLGHAHFTINWWSCVRPGTCACGMSKGLFRLDAPTTKRRRHYCITRATLSVALYARQMQFTWDHIHYLEVSYRECQNIKVYLLA